MPNARNKLPKNSELDLARRSFGEVDRTWSNPEFNKMIGVCLKHGREDYAAILCLARYAGLRIHECFRINTAIAEKAIREMAITIRGKGGKYRMVPVQESIRIELAKMLAVTKRGHKLFVPDGIQTHNAIKDLQHFIEDYRDDVRDADSNRPMTFHGLRHTCAAEWYTKYKSRGNTDYIARKQVSQLLGHGHDSVTLIYLASLKMDGDGHV